MAWFFWLFKSDLKVNFSSKLLLENSQIEGNRLMDENDTLVPIKIGDVTIYVKGFPSMTDHKTKNYWSNIGRKDEGKKNIASHSCYGCEATWLELGNRNHPKFKKLRKQAKKLLFSNLHLKTCSFRWMTKCAKHREIKKYARESDEDYASVDRCKTQMQDEFYNRMNLKVDFPSPKGGTTTSGNTVRDAFEDTATLAEIGQVFISWSLSFCPFFLIQCCKSNFGPILFQFCPNSVPIRFHFLSQF